VIKKIIVYTTQGIDTSRFYPEMVIASGTKDIVEKKLIFFYLSIYSHHNPDFARMAVNTFTKDAYSPNPNIRALSIRHLANLRFKGR
jgi:AP-4 complex subunit beta-1